MARIYLMLSAKSDANPDREVRVRFKHGRVDQQCKTNIFIPVEYWDAVNRKIIIPNFRIMNDEKKEFKRYLTEQREKLNNLVLTIEHLFDEADKNDITQDWLKLIVDKYNFPEKYKLETTVARQQAFFDVYDEFLSRRTLSDMRKRHYLVVKRALQRYELFINLSGKGGFTLSLDTFTPDTLLDISKFMQNEHDLHNRYPELKEQYKQYHGQKRRSPNTINGMLSKIRSFIIWANKNDRTTNNPFNKFSVETCAYGTPFYISIEERNMLYRTDLSKRPELEVQRDIFVFQCLIGCRVSDLYKLTKDNIINGAVEYIAGKTKDDRPETVRVPLNSIAIEILYRYESFKGSTLFPYIGKQAYNEAIKAVFLAANLTRKVTVLDPLTRKQVIRPINEIASSHLARRCFVGNLYKKVKDPNLVGALSGHKEGSRAFARYREIDEDMKTELVKMLE